jgi:hypothetical protein
MRAAVVAAGGFLLALGLVGALIVLLLSPPGTVVAASLLFLTFTLAALGAGLVVWDLFRGGAGPAGVAYIICSVCGQSNPRTNSVCFYCGNPLR